MNEPEGTSLDGLGQAQRLGFGLHGPDHGVWPREPGGDGDGFEDGEAPGGDVDELDFVPARAPASVQLLRLRYPSGPACRGDAGRPPLHLRPYTALDDPTAGIRDLLQQLLRERHTRLCGRAGLSCGGRSLLRPGGLGSWSGGLGLPRAKPTGRVGAVCQIVSACTRKGYAPLASLPGDRDQAPVLQCLTGGLVGAGLPDACRAPVFHPLQYRQLPFIDLPFQWPAFNLRLTYDGGMLSVSFLSDGWFEQVARTSGSDVDRVYVRAVGVITVAVGSASLTCWRVGHGGGERNKSGWVPAS